MSVGYPTRLNLTWEGFDVEGGGAGEWTQTTRGPCVVCPKGIDAPVKCHQMNEAIDGNVDISGTMTDYIDIPTANPGFSTTTSSSFEKKSVQAIATATNE